MRILLAQINPTVGDIKGNTHKILQAISHAKDKKADFVLSSEMAITGYPTEDFLLFPHFISDIESAIKKITAATKGIALALGCVRKNPAAGEKPLCNSAAIIDDGNLIGYQDKMLLPSYDVFNERRFFEPATEAKLWTIGNKKIGITICEDIWQHSALLQYSKYLRDPVQELAKLQPALVVNLSASPYSTSHWPKRLAACQNAAIALKCPLLLCNQVGANDSLIFDGRSLHVNASGQLLSRAKAFEEDLLLVDTDNSQQMQNVGNELPPMQELYEALVLGIRDYFQKSGFSKACLGLSGGIDSALVACLAVEALGKENVLGVLMPSRYSSPHSLVDAEHLAKMLEIKQCTIPIEEAFTSFLTVLEPQFTGYLSDVTEENLQARIRGVILMALSNKQGYIVLSTGNKSELAMGYGTLYGDMCGGLGVISDLTKRQVYALSKWINRSQEIIPWNTIHKEPSAELRPNQKDADTLPPYDMIDNVLQAYVEEHQATEQIAQQFGYPQKLVADIIKRIHQNEYKRRQSPPGLRVSDKAFSAGRRLPIVQKYI